MNEIEIIPIYREGKLDRKYWYTSHAKKYLKEKGTVAATHIDLFFTEYRLTVK